VRAAAETDERTIRQCDLQAQDIIASDAVLQATLSARVGRDVAAQRAIGAAGRIRRIKQPKLFHCVLELLGDDTCLHDRHKVAGVDLLDPIHAFHREGNAAASGNAAAHVAVARAAWRYWNLVFIGEAQNRCHRSGAARQGDGVRQGGGHPLIAGVLTAGGGAEVNLASGQQFLQPRE